ncbi:hypothetical protein [Pseudonocardia sp. MH-G8]|uniref:hypothetical protein n=1 Tax=Pseudonocardia sp. MH-G8 TaxID=1854588 RepID=UPI000BA0861A|nr:hypothetical protein [Pseudonocardia sp. MH-G8]OZM79330.1 hypothetical protein CFP66_26650 [Pseudonocardia sp. MH-G8]
MSVQPVAHTATRTPQEVLDAAVAAAHAGGRPDLADRLSATRRLLGTAPVTVQVAGGAQQDRTALVTALLRAGSTRPSFTFADPAGALGTAVDAVVLAVSAARVLGPADLDLVRALRHRSPRILLALTAIDRYPAWPGVLEADLARLRAAGVTAAPFAVSLDQHGLALASGNPSLAASSGIPALARRLDDIAEQAVLGTAWTAAQEALEAVAELAAAPRPGGRRRRTASDRDEPDPGRARRQQVLADGMAAASSDVEFDLRSRVRGAVADAERVVEASDPTRNWDELDAWLRARLTYEGEQTCALLGARAAAITAALERDLGGAPLPRQEPAELSDPFDGQPTRNAPLGRRKPLAARSRGLVMSAYGGLMMTLVLPRIAGVQLPLWAVVAAALGTAVLLGAATLSGERGRRLETSRTRARALIRHRADGFLLVAGKHNRDTLRRIQQDLRDECAARERAHPPLARSHTPARSGRPVDG